VPPASAPGVLAAGMRARLLGASVATVGGFLSLLWPALSGPASLAGAGSPAAEPLRIGAVLAGDFHERAALTYAVDLAAGDYARVAATMQGAALRIVVRAPAGGEILRVESPGDRYGVLAAPVVAAEPGRYLFQVEPQSATEAAAGTFRINLETLRPALPADRLRTETERTLAAAVERIYQGSPADLTQALALSQSTLPAWTRLADRQGEAAACYLAGLSLLLGNRHAEAAPFFERAAALWRDLGDRGGQGKALHQTGRVRRYLGDSQGALAAFQESLALQRAAGQPYSAAHTLYNLARLQSDLGDLQAARAAFEQAMAIYRTQGDRSGEALILDALGGADEREGRASEALDHFARALALARGLDNPNLEAEALDRLGRLQLRLGLIHQAVESLAAAVDRYRAARDFGNEGLARVDLGGLLAEVGEQEDGQTMLAAALPLLRDPRDQARAQLLLAGIAGGQGRVQEAEKLAGQALSTSRAMAHPQGEADALRTMAFLHLGEGEATRARQELEQSLALAERAGSLASRAEALRGLGQAGDAVGDFAAADGALAEALALAGRAANATEEIRILEEMARSRQARGDLQQARAAIEQALARIESQHAQVAGDALRSSYLAAQRQAYEMEVDILQQLDHLKPAAGLAASAFETAERARARGMLDFLGEAQVDLRQGDAELTRQEERLRLELNAKATLRAEALADPGRQAAVAALDEEIAALSASYEIAAARLAASSPDYARLQRPEVRLADLQREALDGDTVLLEYFLAEPRSYLWAVTADSLQSFELPGRARIEALARRVHDALGQPQSGDGTAIAARQDLAALGRLLLAPVAGSLAGKRLAIVADGALLYIPFAALPLPPPAGSGGGVAPPGQPLVVDHEVVHVPSAAVVRELRRARVERSRAPATLALLADPVFDRDDPRVAGIAVGGGVPAPAAATGEPAAGLPGLRRRAGSGERFARLPWTRREAEVAAAEAHGRQVLVALDFRASRSLATASVLARYRVVHFATHGILDTRRPALSGLVLSQVDEHGQPQDGFLRVDDVYRLRLDADLVVLSGCETALGKTVRGEGILGLTRGFFHAGASQVMASLWPVRDRATAELMQHFYRAMLQAGLAPTAALRQAQLELRREPQWRDPYFWAAFIVEGDWRAPAP
jgi:CHAT domain-containing protein